MSSYAPAEPTRPSAPELPPWDSEQPFEDAREAQPVLDAAQDDDDDEQLGDLTDETDLYALLNIDRSATEEDIRNAYRRLALMLHPDKARDPEAKRAADRNFAAVQHAYDVLSDPRKRMIYDVKGEEGVRAASSLGPRLTTPEEVLREYERLASERAREAVNKLVASKGQIVVGLNAEPWLRPRDSKYAGFKNLDNNTWSPIIRSLPSLRGRAWPEVQQVVISHAFTTPLGERTKLSLRGVGTVRNGVGNGTIAVTLQRPIRGYTNGEITAIFGGRETMVTGKITGRIGDDIVAHLICNGTTLSRPPQTTVFLGRRLFSNVTGFATYTTGDDWNIGPWGDSSQPSSAFSIGMGSDGPTSWELSLQAGIQDSRVEANWGTSFKDGIPFLFGFGKTIKFGFSVAASAIRGVSYSFNADGKMDKDTKIGMAVEASGNGVSLLLRWNWMNQRVSFPIRLLSDFEIPVVLGAAVLPLALAFIGDTFILKPRRNKAKEDRKAAYKLSKADHLSTRKQTALEAQELMKPTAARKAEAETKEGGLVIVSAVYGKVGLSKIQGMPARGEENVDVQVVLQAAVVDGKLQIAGGHSKSAIVGFYDPCPGDKKELVVTYRFRNILHRCTVEDKTPLLIPLREHQIANTVGGEEDGDIVEAVPVVDAKPRGLSEDAIAGPSRTKF